MAKIRKAGNGVLKLYTSYNFTDKDPVIDKMRNMVKREGLKYGQLSKMSGVSSTTMHNWFEGKTKRPQYATVMAVVMSMGYRVNYVKKGE
jgi:DNA-binding phage protein